MSNKASKSYVTTRRAAADASTRPQARALPETEGGGLRAAGVARSDSVRLAQKIARLESQIAEMRAKMRELEAHALLDPLTELFNRRGFARELARADAHIKRYGGRAVLAFFDLDGFKAVNDRHGHAAGDALLQAIAAMLKRNVRASDTAARLGGDEFAVLLWNLSDTDAAAKAAALERAIALTTIEWEGARVCVGASAGTAPVTGPDPSAALAQADAAMYQRKRRPSRAEPAAPR